MNPRLICPYLISTIHERWSKESKNKFLAPQLQGKNDNFYSAYFLRLSWENVVIDAKHCNKR